MALVGIVNVPVVVDIVKPLIVLFVNASLPANVAKVPVTCGKVNVCAAAVVFPIKFIFPLFVSVVPLPIVNVPVVVDIVNPLMVLFVNDSLPANVAKVPVVGNVILVAAVLVNVEA